jgi:Rrf2 family protein
MLRLTKKADYSLIALRHFASKHHLASKKGISEALSAKELAESSGIPLPLLSKLLQKLGKTGFLISEYGTNGGYRLAREPRDISALQVIRAIDGPIVLANCFTADSSCGHSSRCTIKRPLRRIHEGILRLLESVSIQDMLQDSDDGSLSDLLVSLPGPSKFSPEVESAASPDEVMSLVQAAGALRSSEPQAAVRKTNI